MLMYLAMELKRSKCNPPAGTIRGIVSPTRHTFMSCTGDPRCGAWSLLAISLARFAKQHLAADAMWSMAFMAFLRVGMRIAEPRNEWSRVRGRRGSLI